MSFSNQLSLSANPWRQKKQLITRCFSLCMVFVLMAAQVFAQATKTVSGTVRDDHGQSVPGVTVSVKGTTTGTVTDIQGHYSLKVSGNATLVFSSIGYLSVEEAINNRATINVTLKDSEKSLNEVVVIGYGTVKKKDLTGAVASVSGKDIAATPVTNVAQALQGKLPGVSIVSQDGRPNADVAIRVRGGTSITQSNQPLVLIDGQPGTIGDVPGDQVESIDVLKDASSTAIYGTRGANGVILITTKAAKAGKTVVTYNGYVKINTPTKYLQALNPYDYLKYVWANAAANGAAYQTPFEKYYGLGANSGANTGGINSYQGLATDDPQKQVYHQSTSWNHALTLSGGTDKTKMLFSTTYADEQGMKVNSYLKRLTANFKLSHKIADNLTFDLNTRYTSTPIVDDEGTSSGSGSLLSSAYRFRPIATDHVLGDKTALLTGNIEQYGKNSMWDMYNPAVRAADFDPYSITDGIASIQSLTWGIIKGLTYHTDFNVTKSWGQRKYWSGAIYNATYTDDSGNKLYAGNVDYRKTDSWSLRWTNTLNYEFNINKIHNFSVLAGQEVSNSGGTGLATTATYFPANYTEATAFANINQYDKTKGLLTTTSSVSVPNRILSYFGRANYSLLDRYLVTVTFRADASSHFPPANRWGYFPAAALAWRVTEEKFMKNVKWLDYLKVRASFGEVGNDLNSSGLWTQTWASVTDQRLNYDLGHQPQAAYDYTNSTTLANLNLKWETTITRDLGFDFTLFGDKLSGTVDVYHNTTKDLLLQTVIPGITGFSTTYANVGQTSNKGVEISLSGTIFKSKDWRVSASGNINFNKNNVDQLAPSVTGLYGTSWASSASYPTQDYVLKVGNPVGLVRGFTYTGYYTPADFNYSNGVYTLKPGVPDLGTFQGVTHGLTTADKPSTQVAYPGLPKYKDLNGDGKIDDNDVSVIGNMNPKHTGGFNLSAGYKNIDLSLNFNWSYGNQVYNVNKLASLYGNKEAGVYENKLSIVNNAYKIYDVVNGSLVRLSTPDQLNAANGNASLPLGYSEGGVTSTLGIEDGSFLRLNTLTLGYTVPKKVLTRAKISNLRIYGSIYNVFTITGYSGLDPEVNTNLSANSVYPTPGFDFGTYPRARSFVIGVNLNF
ncbi:TonB-linked SusC/RagA family outer membrane protein [Mucilaginibacter yixingensis]|uniref:TonB-linked SusC/RagA family outer membrane protein n=1 Tax=Mucilaginibacter yixingensis TaxID=1295612 RepID=A0A2T5J8I9_9SPHI|nr:TonB-dependent receptor [Mucilaginibacter yixingensis]PTQ95783.1 TonB-linked SusC/RagA family outer membrane protein [Mucilaginibacter yixingensis]